MTPVPPASDRAEKPEPPRGFAVRLFACYLPGLGMVGLALYQLLTEHHWDEAFQTLGEAAVLFGVGKVGGQVLSEHSRTHRLLSGEQISRSPGERDDY